MTKEIEDKIHEAAKKSAALHFSATYSKDANTACAVCFKDGALWAIDTILPDVLSWMQTMSLETWRKWKEYNYQPEDIMKEYSEYLKTKA